MGKDTNIKKVAISSGNKLDKKRTSDRKMVSGSSFKDKMIRSTINKGK